MINRFVFLCFFITFLSACASNEPEISADYEDKYILEDNFYYEIRMSSEMPYDEFIYSINDRVKYNDHLDSDDVFFSTSYNIWNFYESSSNDEGNSATYLMRLNWEYNRGDKENSFKLYSGGDRNYIKGLGFGFMKEGSDIKAFRFSEIHSLTYDILNDLKNISFTKKGEKKISGDFVVDNDDATAFANIQRLYSSSYFSTNSKDDSEKTGYFVISPYGVKFNFKIYPYKNVSKVKYSFYVPAEYTYYSYYIKKENGYYVESDKIEPKVVFDKGFSLGVIEAAKKSFND
ncbi:hypothetical protein [Marinomonas ostreistagni]|uniref:Lipoprotein n=1 Tax=Marinomonas ostreistagni TaxID=359209 RepID=A0ABS0ZAE0_9GAMM|nr:hypothetical protein [Marinomonas ostreistagni]MBJ7550178.1 hypothetical protein [Marinomonas ostreistagni]